MSKINYQRVQQFLALTLALMLSTGSAAADVIVRGTQGITMPGVNGITMTGVDSVRYVDTKGITMTGVDALLSFKVNGITMTGVDAQAVPDVDGTTFTGLNSIRAQRTNSLTIARVDGITMTGVDAMTITGGDGKIYRAHAIVVKKANGITMTGVDRSVITGIEGLRQASGTGLTMVRINGITMTGVDAFKQIKSGIIIAIGPDGKLLNIPSANLSVTGVGAMIMTGIEGAAMTGLDGLTMSRINGITMTGVDATAAATEAVADSATPGGLQSVDPELALWLSQAPDDSSIQAVVVYHQMPEETDFADLQRLGLTGGTRFHRLPFAIISATRQQLEAISELPSVRALWGQRALQLTADTSRAVTGVTRARQDVDVTRQNNELPVTGRRVGVALLDTGLDATHPDLAGRARNVTVADAKDAADAGFTLPTYQENLPQTDQASGHGTFVGGLIAGNGARSAGRYAGVAPDAQLLALGAGDFNLVNVLSNFDYLLEHAAASNVRVVNCSFSANTIFDVNDPVNIATKMITDQGINVVFAAGNAGPGHHSLNPYATAPWVISVGATDGAGRLSSFSARGSFGSQVFRPTLVAPGVDVVSLRSATAPHWISFGAIASSADAQSFTDPEAPFYMTASGTSFSAPQVAGTIALMLEANRQLTPAQVRDILQRTATPLPAYYAHEVGAGMLNAHAAVIEAAFPERRIGAWRATLDRGQVRFVKDAPQEFGGTVMPGAAHEAQVTIPQDVLLADVQIGWGPVASVNDLGLSIHDASSAALITQENTRNRPGLTGKRERAALARPSAGMWRVSVSHTTGQDSTPQNYSGLAEFVRAEYAAMSDVDGLSLAAREEIRRVLRSFVMFPANGSFQPGGAVSRSDLAAALVLGARVPQYLPGQPTFSDVTDQTTMNFVESVQAAPGGALFADVAAGGAFRPDENAQRLTAAIALVRAAGLRSEAEHYSGAMPLLKDWRAIPVQYRGYVAVALAKGLLTAEGARFNPSRALTRAELAHAMVTIADLATIK